MRFLLQNETNSKTNPVLTTFVRNGGILLDPFSLEFQIFDRIAGTPTQVFPLSGRHAVDLVNDRIEKGYFAAAYTVDAAEPRGLHSIKWFLQPVAGDPELVYEQEFDVLNSGTIKPFGQRCYALLSEVRAEDLPETMADDNRVLRAIADASSLIENFTNRTFGSAFKTFRVDGRGAPDLLIREPIVALAGIEILSHAFGVETQVVDTELEDLGIYNRHLSQNLLDPDDRENPKVSFFRINDQFGQERFRSRPLLPHFTFDFGQQNIQLSGAFGYTEPDGSPMGDIPRLLRTAAVLLTGRNVGKKLTGGSAPAPGGPVKRLKTRDQEVEYAVNTNNLGGAAPGPFTGDPEVDNILLMFARSTTLGAA